MELPGRLLECPWGKRIEAAVRAVRSAGAALMALRGEVVSGVEADGGQLKTSVDMAAEGWVLGFLEACFPGDRFLSEERFERAGVPWPGETRYWTVDALDGTRSFIDGYDGFCVQVAYIDDGVPRFGAIAEPVTGAVFAGAAGAGAYRLHPDTPPQSLAPLPGGELCPGLRFVDSTRPSGPVGALFAELDAEFVECGSVGLKIARLLDGSADVYAKAFEFKLWDVAPGAALLAELDGQLSTWDGARIDYAGSQVRYRNVLASADALHGPLVERLSVD